MDFNIAEVTEPFSNRISFNDRITKRSHERIAKFLDPFGHDWMIGTHIEDVTPEETQRRFNALLEGAKSNDEAKES